MSQSVNSYVVEHGINDDNIRIIIDKMARKLYESPAYYGFSNQDEISEVFATYWNRIVSAVKNYSEKHGATFETFFLRTIQFLKINCFRSSMRTAQYDYSIISDMVEDSRYASFDHTAIFEFDTQSLLLLRNFFTMLDIKNSDAIKSRILMLCLKCSLYIDAKELASICTIAGISEKQLNHLIMIAQVKFAYKKTRYEKLQERRNVLWLRLMNLELRVYEQQDSAFKSVLLQKLEKLQQSYYRSVERIRKCKLDLSNAEVASILEIPKPTVDSGLLRLKKLFEKVNVVQLN
mgnify:FL=1